MRKNVIKKEKGRSDYSEKRESFQKRKRVNYLYLEKEYSKREIARLEDVSTDFVVKWTQSPDQDLQVDNRGWPKGKLTKWNGKMKGKIKSIREELENDPEQFYIGPTAVQIEHHRRYPEEDLPPVRTIGKILSDLDMTNEQQKGKNKGAAKYLRYPEKTIYEKIGDRILEADFVGEKYITGRTEPINFIGYSFKKEPRLHHFQRVDGETTDEFINKTEKFFSRFEKPDVVKVDNAMAMIGGGRGERALSWTMIFLLENQIYSVYSVPKKSFTQASIGGKQLRICPQVLEQVRWFGFSRSLLWSISPTILSPVNTIGVKPPNGSRTPSCSSPIQRPA
ncbi:hypothetical protein KGY79_10415 [Candidatus Bipolaricaulota bacterium]|nr:hypothetical protein [Candidatus Bipolaricaulota bacterium]